MPSIVLGGHQRDTFFAASMEDGPGNDRGSGHEETRVPLLGDMPRGADRY